MATEKQIENDILTYLNGSKLGFFWKNNSIGVYDPVKKVFRKPKNKFLINGVSDILGVLNNGQICCIEVKTPKTKKNTSDNQKHFLSAIKLHGGCCGVAWDIESAVEIITNSMSMQ